MSTSGTVTYSVNTLDIVTDALETIGVKDPGESVAAEHLAVALRKLNMITKQWTAQLDFAPGLKMWTRRRATMFLQKAQVAYELGPSGDHATETYAQTTLSVAASNGAASVTLTSVTGVADTYNIGVVLDSGRIHWTTVSGAPAGSVVTLAAVLTGAAAAGNTVFCYQTKMRRPFRIDSAVRRDAASQDSPVDAGMLLEEYEAIPDKSSEGSPSRLYFEAQRTDAVVYVDCAPEDVTDVIRLVYLSYIEDFSAPTNDADFPAEWFRPLALQLGMDLCMVFRRPVPQALPALLTEALTMARKAYPERVAMAYESDPDEY